MVGRQAGEVPPPLVTVMSTVRLVGASLNFGETAVISLPFTMVKEAAAWVPK